MEKLKNIITGFAEECGQVLSKTGKKQELIDRITFQLDKLRYQGYTEQWKRARDVLLRVRQFGVYVSSIIHVLDLLFSRLS